MRKIFDSLSLWFLMTTSDKHDLIRKIQYLKVENRILRGKLPKQISITAREKQRLLKYGKAIGSAIKELITIVTPRTFARWLRAEKSPPAKKPKPPGRPKTDADIRDLVLRLARENAWGYTRIHGELKKLGVTISRSTVANILREHGIDPGPLRSAGTWNDFIHRNRSSLWACDFFSVKTWTMRGAIEFYVLFFIHIGSRRVHIAGMTPNPDHVWMAQQARNVSMFFAEQPVQPKYLIRDYDGKFSPQFDAILASDGIEVIPVGPRAPNLNAYAERWVQSARRECLDHFIILGEKHLRYILREYETFHNQERPHQGVGNVPLTTTESGPANGRIVCRERLGGLLKHYYRKTG